VMLCSAATAAWCSLLWDLAALNKLHWSFAAQHSSTARRQESGSANKGDADSVLAILCSSKHTRRRLNRDIC
jgi:hypothetical protein